MSVADVDVIVIGAGIAGLAAARELQDDDFEVVVLEARERPGGRIVTWREDGLLFDAGAGWIHGPRGNPLGDLSDADTFVTDDENLRVYSASGEIIGDDRLDPAYKKYLDLIRRAEAYAEDEDEDMSLERAIRAVDPGALDDPFMRYQLGAYLEFSYGGSIADLSAWNHSDDETFSGKDVVLPGGYDVLLEPLAAGLDIRTGCVVERIDYGDDGVEVFTDQGSFEADYVLVTLPLGVLKEDSVEFDPPLPGGRRRLIEKVAMGNVNKVGLVFDETFWPETVQYFGYLSDEKGKYPYFLNALTFSDMKMLLTLALGEYADAMEDQDDERIIADVMTTLRTIFSGDAPDPRKTFITRWRDDPFSRGAYSFNNTGVEARDFEKLGEPIEDVLFFAGEHTSAEYRGTTHGALLSGRRAAREIMEADEED